MRVLTPREQTDSLQFSCEKMKTNQEKDRTENRALTRPLCSQQVQLAVRTGCQRPGSGKAAIQRLDLTERVEKEKKKWPLINTKTQHSLECSGQSPVCGAQRRPSPQLGCNCGYQEVESARQEMLKQTQSFSTRAMRSMFKFTGAPQEDRETLFPAQAQGLEWIR